MAEIEPDATAKHFKDEMGDHPLGDCKGTKAVGPYVVELYERVIGNRARQREGKPARAVVTVHKRNPDHWRAYESMANAWVDEADGREEFDSLASVEAIEAFIDQHGDDDG